jgi:hypothetical protein
MMRTGLMVLLVLVSVVSAVSAEPSVHVRRQAPPEIVATVTDGPAGTTADRWSLAQIDTQPVVEVRASALRRYQEMDEPIAIVVLVEGHFLWMGNTSYEEDEDAKYPGAHAELLKVMDVVREIGPPGSVGALVTYHKGAEVLRPMGPLRDLDRSALGTERDYAGHVTRDLVSGVSEAITQLRRTTAPRKALIVLTDGADTNIEHAKTQLAQLRKLCEQDRIETHAIVWSANIGEEMTAIKSFVPAPFVAQTVDEIPSFAATIADRIHDRYELVFQARDFTWDGCDHEVQLRLDGAPFPTSDPITLAPGVTHMCNQAKPTDGSDSWPWIALLLGAGALGVITILIKTSWPTDPGVMLRSGRRRRRRRE